MADVEFLSNSNRVEALFGDGVFDGLVHAAEFLLTESRVEAPLDESPLRHSGAVTQDRSIDTVAVGYDTPYAVRQHEELTYRHPEPGTKAKYLEDPVNNLRDEMFDIVAETARRHAAGG